MSIRDDLEGIRRDAHDDGYCSPDCPFHDEEQDQGRDD